MKLTDALARLNTLQRARRFKIAASALTLAALAALFLFLWVKSNEPGIVTQIAQRGLERARAVGSDAHFAASPSQALQRLLDSAIITLNPDLFAADPNSSAHASDHGPLLLTFAFAAPAAALLSIIWLGLSFTYLLWLTLGWGLGLPIMFYAGPASWIGELLVAATPLALIFLSAMELLALALSGPRPILAIARNVLAEAVRMKVSLVFIILLLLLLAYVPGALNTDQPLRYRIQQWLQYGMGLSYLVLALLTTFLSVATISFEQRDRVIWQTMTKPVHPLEYLLGKWLGVMALNLVLLAVTASGVFLFTEYLRRQPANGELAFNVRADGVPTLGDPSTMADDRQLLETQVLVARQGRFPEPADITRSPAKLHRLAESAAQERINQTSDSADHAKLIDEARDKLVRAWYEALDAATRSRIADMIARDPSISGSPPLSRKIESEILAEWESQYRSIPVNGARSYLFTNLPPPPDPTLPSTARPMTLRYKLNAGSNNPSDIYRVLFQLGDQRVERQVALNATQTLVFDSALVEKDGALTLILANSPDNEREISFPPDGLEVLFTVGGYESNFLRIATAMWIKLAFIAAVGVTLGSFLGFPVACLVSLSILFMAESASYLNESLEYYTSITKEGIDYVAVAARVIAVPVGWIFSVYSELQPTENLVSGRLVAWTTLLRSLAVLGAWTIAVLSLGWLIFRQRELATYSGH